MFVQQKSVLLVGFNTRPLAYSLNQAGYEVYAVDFFGDLDLYPNVKDSIIVMNKLQTNYNLLKDTYSNFLAEFAIELLKKHPDVSYLLIGSGLDDAYEGRESILNELKNKNTISVNNNLETIIKARDIESIYKFLESMDYEVPISYSYDKFKSNNLSMEFPFILKKKRGAGGTSVFKIESEEKLKFQIKKLEIYGFNPSEWLIQEYIEGLPISCTIIANGTDCAVISINRQIIGLDYLNSPNEFIYCGNIVPSYLPKEDERLISEISLSITKELNLKGINGFDFVLRKQHAYLMEINPRVPGSIRASELVLNLNLLDLHIQSFFPDKWSIILDKLNSTNPNEYATKLIKFAPKDFDKEKIVRINNLKYVHDKSDPENKIHKNEPICTVLFKGKNLSESFFGALKIVDQIDVIID